MPHLSTSGRVAISEIVYSRPMHLAWGRGDGVWVSPPDVEGDETALADEIGRRKPEILQYVTPDDAGLIILPDGNFSKSAAPTRHLHVRFEFDYSEAVGEAIREVALFTGSVVSPSLPEGQQYFTPDQIVSPGRLLFLKHYVPIPRLPGAREWFEMVISF